MFNLNLPAHDSMIPLLILIAGYWFLVTQTSFNGHYVTVGYFGLLIVYLVVRSILNQTKLTQLEMLANCCRLYAIAQAVSFIGIAWFFFPIFHDM